MPGLTVAVQPAQQDSPAGAAGSSGRMLLNRTSKVFEAGYCMLADRTSSLMEDLSFLHVRERGYYDGLRAGKRRSEYLLGRKAAKGAIHVLAPGVDPASIAIDFGVFQFPVLQCAELHNLQVSISHCNEISVALAFPEEHPMGIDLERLDPDNAEIMKGLLTSREAGLIAESSLDLSVGSALIWTVKEALSKIFRTGLTVDTAMLAIASLEMGAGMDAPVCCSFQHVSQYRSFSFIVGDHICSLVLPKNTDPQLDLFFAAYRSLFIPTPPPSSYSSIL